VGRTTPKGQMGFPYVVEYAYLLVFLWTSSHLCCVDRKIDCCWAGMRRSKFVTVDLVRLTVTTKPSRKLNPTGWQRILVQASDWLTDFLGF
jgi:hypothetical protein